MPGTDHEHFKIIAIAVVAAWAGLLSWLGKRQIIRIDGKVDREEYNSTIKSLRGDNEALSKRIDDGNTRLYDKLEQDAREQRARDDRMLEAIHAKSGDD